MKNKKIYSIYMLACMLNIGFLFSTSHGQADDQCKPRSLQKRTYGYSFLTEDEIDGYLQISNSNSKKDFILIIPKPLGEVSLHQLIAVARPRELSVRLIMLSIQDITERILNFLSNLKMLPPDIAASDDDEGITYLAVFVDNSNDEQSKLLINLFKKYQVGVNFLSFWFKTEEAASSIKKFIEVQNELDKIDIEDLQQDHEFIYRDLKPYPYSIRWGTFNFKRDVSSASAAGK